MSDELVAQFLEVALDCRSRGEACDLREICGDHPELIPEVERLLRIDDVIDHDQPQDALLGVVLDDRYELRTCIGVGAMGTVYLADDRTLGREVAVKLLQNGLFASAERHERFSREAKVLATLRHPNIVSVHDHGRSGDGLHYIIMERLVGMPLAEVLHQAEVDGRNHDHRLDDEWLQRHFEVETQGLGYLPQVVLWCVQVADALREAHASGVMHRDVKPTNIFVEESGSAILLDFGIAARAGDGSLTSQGSTIGSPWYMAPEQVSTDGAVSARVDIYGLCATLYHLATLRPPFEGDYAQVLAQLATREPIPPRRVRPELSQDLCAVIEKGMERDPARRYRSMAELGEDLRALVAQVPVKARPISRFARWARSVRRRPSPYVAAALLVVAIGVTIPVVSGYRDSVHAREDERREQYVQTIAALAPSMAFEASFEMRPQLDPVERQGYVDQLSRAIELQPDDLFVRLLRSALLLDRGDLAASLADVQWIARREPSAFLDAFASRYAQVDRSKPGVLGLDFAGLPACATESDRVVMGFQLCRARKNDAAIEVLQSATGTSARSVRLGLLCGRGVMQLRSSGQRTMLDELLVEIDLLEQVQGGPTARSLYWRGQALVELREWQLAATVLERSRRLCPNAYGTLYNLGISLAHLGRRREALEHTRRARQLRPHSINAVQQVAALLAELGQYEQAQREADAIEATGHTTQPWHHDFFVGYVAHLRSVHAYGERRFEDAEQLRIAALASYAEAAQLAQPDSRVARTIARNARRLAFHESPPAERVEALLGELDRNPDSPLFLRALATALEQSDVIAPPVLRVQFVALLRRRAGQIVANDSR